MKRIILFISLKFWKKIPLSSNSKGSYFYPIGNHRNENLNNNDIIICACNAGDPGLSPGSGRSSGEGHGYPLQFSCLENPMDRGAWQATVNGVTRVRHNLATKPPLNFKLFKT